MPFLSGTIVSGIRPQTVGFPIPLFHQIEASKFPNGRIPIAYPEGPTGPVRIKVISGKSHGVESPVRPLGGCWYFHVIFDKQGTIFQQIRALIYLSSLML
jgi:hypothetical protein